MPLRGGGEDGRVVVVGVRSLVGCGLRLRIGLSGSLSRIGVLDVIRGIVLRDDGLRLPNLVGTRGHLVGDLRLCIGLGGRLVSSRFLGRIRGLRDALVGRLVGGGVLDVRVLRSRALSLGILSALGVLGRLLCLRLDTSFVRVGILSIVLCLVTRIVGARLLSFAGCGLRIGLDGSLSRRLRDLRVLNRIRALDGFFCVLVVTSLAKVGASDTFDLIAVNRPGLIGRLVLVHRRAAVSGRLRRLGRLRLRRVPLTESRVHSGLAGRTISRSPCVTHATSSTGGRVVGQVAARPEIGEDLDVPGTGQPAEQVGIGGRVGRQRRPQVGPALCDGGLQGLVRSLSGNRRIGLMRRHHELNRIHAEPFRENVWVTSTDRARSQPIPGPSPGSDHPRW